MPRAWWSATRERQYKHILKSCLRKRSKKVCSRIAAATVNASRRAAGELKENIMARRRKHARRSKKGCGCPKGARKVKGGACLSRRTRKFVKKSCR